MIIVQVRNLPQAGKSEWSIILHPNREANLGAADLDGIAIDNTGLAGNYFGRARWYCSQQDGDQQTRNRCPVCRLVRQQVSGLASAAIVVSTSRSRVAAMILIEQSPQQFGHHPRGVLR